MIFSKASQIFLTLYFLIDLKNNKIIKFIKNLILKSFMPPLVILLYSFFDDDASVCCFFSLGDFDTSDVDVRSFFITGSLTRNK